MYEDYMQNMLGVPIRQFQNTYEEQDYNPYWNYYDEDFRGVKFRNQLSCDELENCYPEIYKVVYPMVRKACSLNTFPITQTLIDNIVNDISSNIEGNQFYEININLDNEVMQNRDMSKKSESNNKQTENRSCDRQIGRNPLLNDLIRILVLRELFGRPEKRPPFPPNRPRPPFPPNRPGPRPPFVGY